MNIISSIDGPIYFTRDRQKYVFVLTTEDGDEHYPISALTLGLYSLRNVDALVTPTCYTAEGKYIYDTSMDDETSQDIVCEATGEDVVKAREIFLRLGKDKIEKLTESKRKVHKGASGSPNAIGTVGPGGAIAGMGATSLGNPFEGLKQIVSIMDMVMPVEQKAFVAYLNERYGHARSNNEKHRK